MDIRTTQTTLPKGNPLSSLKLRTEGEIAKVMYQEDEDSLLEAIKEAAAEYQQKLKAQQL